MFNHVFYLTVLIMTLCEGYRISLNNIFTSLTSLHKSKLRVKWFTFQIIAILLYFNFYNSVFYEQSVLLCFLLSSLFIFCLFIETLLQKNINFFTLFSVFSVAMYRDFNLISFIYISELLSLTSFFLLYLNNVSNLNTKRLSVVYFIISNIFIFFFGVVLSLIILKCYGTGNVNLICFQCYYKNNVGIVILLLIYTALKLGQGPLNFFKFKFYRLVKTTELLYYIFTYVILVWPLLVILLTELFAIIPGVALVALLVVLLTTLLQSIFIYKTFIDFLVFSTWVYSFYIFIFLIA